MAKVDYWPRHDDHPYSIDFNFPLTRWVPRQPETIDATGGHCPNNDNNVVLNTQNCGILLHSCWGHMIPDRFVWYSLHSQPSPNIFQQKFALVSCWVLASSYCIRTLVCLLYWVLNELTNLGKNEISSQCATASLNISMGIGDCQERGRV